MKRFENILVYTRENTVKSEPGRTAQQATRFRLVLRKQAPPALPRVVLRHLVHDSVQLVREIFKEVAL